MKKFDPEKNMIDLQGFELSYMPATPNCGVILKALLAANFLFYLVGNINQTLMALRNCLEVLRDNQRSNGNKVRLTVNELRQEKTCPRDSDQV